MSNTRFVMCFRCDEIFAAEASRYYFCRCGEPLTDGDEVRGMGTEPRPVVKAPVTLTMCMPQTEATTA
jgi:hypothetical protein